MLLLDLGLSDIRDLTEEVWLPGMELDKFHIAQSFKEAQYPVIYRGIDCHTS